MSDKVTLSIDGKSVTCEPDERLIDVAKREGTYIPRFCYHPKLSVVASCRMCLVEIEGMGKTQPACATVVANDMVVKTQSKKAIESQKAIMQFLLINHPLHCPICDQGGECELQDTAMGYGEGVSEFSETKRNVEDENLGPLVATDMSLCIHCTRCVRFGKEIAGVADLGLVGRGDSSQISTYLNTGLKSELSGNMIDLCPVGALTSKPFKFKGRSWGFKQHKGISPHDCIGSNLNYHTIAKGYDQLSEVMRVLPLFKPSLNENWLSDRDRFSYEGIQAKERLLTPMIKSEGEWKAISWEKILSILMHRFSQMSIKDKKKMGVWLSSQMTTEEGYLAQHIFRQFGVDNIDHRLWENIDNMDDLLRPSNIDMNALDQYDHIVLIGSNIRYEQPILSLKIKLAADKGVKVTGVGAVHHDHIFPYTHHLTSPQTFAKTVFEITAAKQEGGWFDAGTKVLYILGEEALIHVQSMEIKQIIHKRCSDLLHEYLLLPPGANSLGLIAAGCVPYQSAWAKSKALGLNYQQMLDKPIETMWLHQVDPAYDVSNLKKANAKLKQAFVVAVTSFDTPGIKECADVMLPLSVTAESPGSFINFQGIRQHFYGATAPMTDAKMGWSIYQVLASLLSLDVPVDYQTVADIVDKEYAAMQWPSIQLKPLVKPNILDFEWMRLGLSAWVRSDMQLRHAHSLQAAYPVDQQVYMNDSVSNKDMSQFSTQVVYSNKVAKGVMVYEKGQVFYDANMGAVEMEGEST